MGKYNGVSSPFIIYNSGQISNIFSPNDSGDCSWIFVVDKVLLSNFTPPSSLAVEHPNNSRKIIHIPYLQEAAIATFNEFVKFLYIKPKKKMEQATTISIFHIYYIANSFFVPYLFPSLAGSENRQSFVGLPGSLALNIEPSGSASFFNRLKSWCPGASLQM